MIAKVFLRSGEFFVGLTVRGIPVDEAGPFDDEVAAVEMARRSVGAENVRFLYGSIVDTSESDLAVDAPRIVRAA